jgi:hypothetical protein
MVRRGSTVRVRQRALRVRKWLQTSSSVVWISSAEHLSSAFQATIEVASTCAKCLQIDLLPGATEHLLGTEGLDEPCSERLPAQAAQ